MSGLPRGELERQAKRTQSWLMLTCAEDLLPGVREHGAKMYSGAREWLGAVPTRMSSDGKIYKISGYGAYQATNNEIREWIDSDYNLILQTRRIRALTITYPAGMRDELEEQVRQAIGWTPRITYGRECRITFLFEIDGVGDFLTKRGTLSPAGKEIKTAAQNRTVTLHGTNSSVEVYGVTRQGVAIKQHIVADEVGVPKVSAKALEALWFSLVERRGALFERHEAVGLFIAKHGPAEFVRWLHKRRRVLEVRPNGDLLVQCPVHKNSRTRASNGLAVVSQDASGATTMVCPHPGCAGRPLEDFQRRMGFIPSETTTPDELYRGDPLAKVLADLGAPDAVAITSESGKSMAPATTPSVKQLIAQYGAIL